MAGLNKKLNCYADQIKEYDRCPKAVFAAIAVSALTCGGDHLEEANTVVINEWWALFDSGVVPQKPPVPRSLSSSADGDSDV